MKALSKLFHQTFGVVISWLKEHKSQKRISEVKNGVYYVNPKPEFTSQLAFANKKKIRGYYKSIADKTAMKRFGSRSVADFSYWAWRACGIVAVQMVLKTVNGASFTKNTRQLIDEGLELDGYNIQTDHGWFHSSLVALAQRYGLEARTEKFVPVSRIAEHLLQGEYVIASLKSKSGGHLVLIYGVLIKNHAVVRFITHDPYDYTEEGNARVYTRAQFEKLTTRRIIMLKRKV